MLSTPKNHLAAHSKTRSRDGAFGSHPNSEQVISKKLPKAYFQSVLHAHVIGVLGVALHMTTVYRLRKVNH